MCVTCLGHNQHTQHNHNNCKAPLHNLNKVKSHNKHTGIDMAIIDMYACMQCTI